MPSSTTGRVLRAAAGAILAAAAACSAAISDLAPPGSLTGETRLELAGHFSIPSRTRVPDPDGPPFGGISGLAPTGRPGEYIAVSDDRVDHRIYRVRVTGEGPAFRVEPLEVIPLDDTRGPRLDPEAIVVTRRGDLLISSEGREGPVPPFIARYSAAGAFIRELPIPRRFIRHAPGEPPRGARDNAGFESLSLSPDGTRLFTASETALVQDGAPVSFDDGATARLLEYVAEGETFTPRREFAYPIEAMDPAPFTAGNTACGVVELLALSRRELIALERTYLEVASQRRGINRIHLFHLSLDGADDVSAIDSLKGRTGIAPVRKTLLLELSALAGLPPELTTLDNFEGLAAGPRLADGSRSLLLVSDDNFNDAQQTTFLLLRITGG